MKKFKRRSFGSGSRLEQPSEEAPLLDLSRDAAENMRELLSEITKKETMPTSKRMGYLNNFAQFIRCVPPTSNFGFTLQEIAACLRVALISPAKEVRAAGFRAFRHLLMDEECLQHFLSQRIDIFIVKALDMLPIFEVERVQALRLVRKMVYLCPQSFPISLAMALASISSDSSQEKDRLCRACLATLCELAVQNIEIASYAGVMKCIVLNALDCSIPRMNESLVSTILYLFNRPKYRTFVRRNVGLEALLAPFTDLYYCYNSETPDVVMKEDQGNRLENSKLALIAIVRSWAGLFSLCDSRSNVLESFIGVFKLPHLETRRVIIDALFEIFCIRKPVLTKNFQEALNSVDPSAPQESWKLSADFLIPEADAVLSHRAHGNRTNLIESYLALLLSRFISADILPSLVVVITTSDDEICIRGSILLGELLHLANNLLPPGYSGHTHCLPTLISLATSLAVPTCERGKASAAVGYLDQLHHMKKQGPVAKSLFLEQLLAQASHDQTHRSRTRTQEKLDMPVSWRDFDETLSAIRDTQVVTSRIEQYQLWNWDLISTVVESPRMSIKRHDDPTFYRFMRQLLLFYKPTMKRFSAIEQSNRMARKYSEVGLQIVDFLLQKEEQPEGEKLLLELLHEIRDGLGEAVQPGSVNGVFSSQSLNDTLTRDYFLFIGRLSSTATGTRVLEKTSGIFQYLMDICCMPQREVLMKLIISSFGYGRDGIARVLLSKALTAAPLSSRMYATKFLRVLLRAKSPYFSNWGIEFLTNQLYDQENEIVMAALDILEESCEDEANLQRLIEVKPALLHLGENGVRLLSRYVSVSRGFSFLQDMDYLNVLIDSWKENYSREYVRWMEMEIAEALSTYERHGADGNYIRRSGFVSNERRDVFVLPHLYGELAQHRSGIGIIQDKSLFSDAVSTIVNGVTETCSDILQLKSALWALGHIASSTWGIGLILLSSKHPSQATSSQAGGSLTTSDPFSGDADDVVYRHEDSVDVVALIVDMAKTSEVLTIRGTCFYVLCLIAKTFRGAEKLEELNWQCVRHKGADRWPVVSDQDEIYIFEESYSDTDSDTNSVVDIEASPQPQPILPAGVERFGGIYMGDDLPENESAAQPPISFQYVIHTYGDEKRKKGGKVKATDESRYLHQSSLMGEELSEPNVKVSYYDVDASGEKYRKSEPESLISLLERMYHGDAFPGIAAAAQAQSSSYGGIYLGDEPGSSFSEQQRPSEESFEDALPFLSGKMKEKASVSLPREMAPEKPRPTRSVFNDHGIYLGEEEVEEAHEDSIEANLSMILQNGSVTPDLKSAPPDFGRRYSAESEPLRPIWEEKSKESLEDRARDFPERKRNDLIGISVEEVTVEVSRKRSADNRHAILNIKTTSLDDSDSLSVISEDNHRVLSPVDEDKSENDLNRLRSVSLTDQFPPRTRSGSRRSSSFSGLQMHGGVTRGSNHPRSDSDPGVRVAPALSLPSSVGSLESDSAKPGSGASETANPEKAVEGREKSHSEVDPDRDRSSSVLSDSSSSARLTAAKRLRGSTSSLGVSPKSSRTLSFADSPYSGANISVNAWNSLRKQRHRRELDAALRSGSSVQLMPSLADRGKFSSRTLYSYRNLRDLSPSGRRGSSPALGAVVGHAYRRNYSTQFSVVSSVGAPSEISNDAFSSPMEEYVGRCIPCNIIEFFQVPDYTYHGSWADNFARFSELHNIRTFSSDYVHQKKRCLECMSVSAMDGKTSRTASVISSASKSRSSSGDGKDSPPPEAGLSTDDESESSTSRDEDSLSVTMENRQSLHKEVLRLVLSLSSAVASKASQQALISLRERYPWAFQDLCLYSQVMEQLGMFTFRLAMRRFIEHMFEGVRYDKILDTADIILGRTLVEK